MTNPSVAILRQFQGRDQTDTIIAEQFDLRGGTGAIPLLSGCGHRVEPREILRAEQCRNYDWRSQGFDCPVQFDRPTTS